MARPLRIEFEGALYHVTSRGNEKGIVYTDDRDRVKFLSLIKKGYRRYGYFLRAHVLMGNHYHLLVETPNANLSKAMHDLNGSYTSYFNHRHKRSGHLFQGRYKAILVEKDAYLLELSRYIHLNPVRAGLVNAPEDYDWSSYKVYLGLRPAGAWLKTDLILNEFSHEPAAAMKHYKEFVMAGTEKEVRSPLKQAHGGLILGSQEFIDTIRQRYIEFAPSESGISRIKELSSLKLQDIVENVADYFEVEPSFIFQDIKCNKLPRKFAVYLARKFTSLSLKEIAEYFDAKSPWALSKTTNRFESELKMDASLKKRLDEIERYLVKMSHVQP